jgi:hypothetical protein
VISLTNPITIAHSLGAVGLPAYDKVVLDSITYSPVRQSITGEVIVCCRDDSHPVVKGKFEITGVSVNITVPALDISQATSLTPEQQVAVKTFIDTAQSQIEQGLCAISLIAGTWSAGT